MSIAVQVALVMVVLLVLLLAAGVPIGVGIGLSSAVSMICMLPSNVAFATSAQRIFAGSNSFSLIAIPFFILAGNITQRLSEKYGSKLRRCSTSMV